MLSALEPVLILAVAFVVLRDRVAKPVALIERIHQPVNLIDVATRFRVRLGVAGLVGTLGEVALCSSSGWPGHRGERITSVTFDNAPGSLNRKVALGSRSLATTHSSSRNSHLSS